MIIYETTNKINGKKYIGKDSKNDENYLGSGILLKLAVKKYGRENFKKEVLEKCNNIYELDEREKYYIDLYNCVESSKYYNMMEGGHGGKQGREAIEKISNSLKNHKMYKSKDRSEKIKKALTGRRLSEEHKAKIKKKMKNRKLSDEHKENISKSRKGIKLTDWQRKRLIEDRRSYKGEQNPFYGKKHSKETLKKMSSNRKNKLLGKENPSHKNAVLTRLLSEFSEQDAKIIYNNYIISDEFIEPKNFISYIKKQN